MTIRAGWMLAVALVLAVVTAGPAAAHAGDPTLVNRLRAAVLPAAVAAELRTTVADELVLTNPTPTVLAVLDADGAEFLRISSFGVAGNAASPYFHLSTAPPGVRVAIPADAAPGAPPVWVPLSAEPSWSWFDPRLSLQYPDGPAGARPEASASAQVATWSIPLRYGAEPVELGGALERRPVTGRFETTLDAAPAGLTAVVGQGFVPALSVQAGAGHSVTVLGRDGRPYLHLRPDGAEVDRASPTHRDDLLGRGQPVTAAEVGRLSLPGSSNTWLDTRLRFPAEDPPAELAAASGPVDVARWEVPVIVDGTPHVLAGAIRWLPNGRTAESSPWPMVALLGGLALLVGTGAALVLRARRLGRSVEAVPEESRERAPVP